MPYRFVGSISVLLLNTISCRYLYGNVHWSCRCHFKNLSSIALTYWQLHTILATSFILSFLSCDTCCKLLGCKLRQSGSLMNVYICLTVLYCITCIRVYGYVFVWTCKLCLPVFVWWTCVVLYICMNKLLYLFTCLDGPREDKLWTYWVTIFK